MSTPTRSPRPSDASSTPLDGGPWRRFWRRVDAAIGRVAPKDITVTTLRLAVLSLVTEILIIVTGGAVRLTESGLGCPTWPKCTPESLTNTPEMGIHGYIEFGNRLITFVVGITAVAVVLWLWNLRRSHRETFWIAVGVFLCIPAQAVVGGITVLTQLNPWVVAFHFLVSCVMVCFATLLVNRIGTELRFRRAAGTSPAATAQGAPTALVDGPTSGLSRRLAHAIFTLGWVVLYLGTVVTGTGPHGGDADAPRHGFDPLIVTRIHAAPVYLMTAASLVLLVVVLRSQSSRLQRISAWSLVAVIAFQAAIGYIQHFTGLPVAVVILHMLGTGLVVWAMTTAWDRQVSAYHARPAVPLHA